MGRESVLGLYTILPLPTLYSVCHTQGKPGAGGSHIAQSRAIVLQSCEQYRWAGQYEGD